MNLTFHERHISDSMRFYLVNSCSKLVIIEQDYILNYCRFTVDAYIKI